MAVDTKSAGEAAAIRSSADLDAAIARIDQQAATADRAIAGSRIPPTFGSCIPPDGG